MREIHKKKIKNVSFIAIVFLGGILILSGCGNKINKQMEKAINDVNSGKYSEAKKELETILKEDSNNSKANLLNNIISNFENAKKLYEDKEYSKANEEISKISSEYSNYNIKNDIDNLKDNINKKLDEIKQIDNKLNELSKLINDGKLDEANKKLSELKDKYITEEQNKKINELKNKLDKKIEQKKVEEKKAKEEQKKREEEKKLEIEKQKEENLKKNSSNRKTTKNKKVTNSTQNQGNIHYANKNFGIQMELPADWKGLYRVETDNDGIYVYVKPQKSEYVSSAEGFLFSIVKKNIFDESSPRSPEWKRYIKAKGETYVIVAPNEYSMRRNHPDWDIYYKLQLDVGRIIKSIRAIE